MSTNDEYPVIESNLVVKGDFWAGGEILDSDFVNKSRHSLQHPLATVTLSLRRYKWSAISENDKTFLTEAMNLWIYEYRKNQGITSEFRHALIIEEAHNILSKKRNDKKEAR